MFQLKGFGWFVGNLCFCMVFLLTLHSQGFTNLGKAVVIGAAFYLWFSLLVSWDSREDEREIYEEDRRKNGMSHEFDRGVKEYYIALLKKQGVTAERFGVNNINRSNIDQIWAKVWALEDELQTPGQPPLEFDEIEESAPEEQ
jgi:hypothetical protein